MRICKPCLQILVCSVCKYKIKATYFLSLFVLIISIVATANASVLLVPAQIFHSFVIDVACIYERDACASWAFF